MHALQFKYKLRSGNEKFICDLRIIRRDKARVTRDKVSVARASARAFAMDKARADAWATDSGFLSTNFFITQFPA
jgi:hypothetical protein